MVDFKITQHPLPIDKVARNNEGTVLKNAVTESSNQPERSSWNGTDRRKRLTERRSLSRKKPIVELRQRKDRRKNSSLSIKV